MNNLDIKDFVTQNNKVYYHCYKKGFFWYLVKHLVSGTMYYFPIPLDDIGQGTMSFEDKAVTYMRWIRKAIQDGTIKKEDEYEC